MSYVGVGLGALQVEFGAHQVILVRDTEAIDRLPEDLQTHNSKALIMTVPQSKVMGRPPHH